MCAAAHVRSRVDRGLHEDLLHRGMVEGELGCPLGSRGEEIAVQESLGSLVSIEPAKLVSAAGPEQIEDPQFPRFGDTPRVHLFAAHTVLEMLLPLEDEDSNSALRNSSGEGRPGQPASDNDDIVREHVRENIPWCPRDRAQISISMTRGPDSLNARVSSLVRASAVSTRTASTPMPRASSTQWISGSARLVSDAACGPRSGIPPRASST